MIERQGDMFTTEAKALGHGVNVFGVMGAGVAAIFSKKYPAMFEEYRALCTMSKLNPGNVHIWRGEDITIFNMASQYRPGPDARLDWLEKAARTAAAELSLTEDDQVLAIPRIGCGIGGLVWEDVSEVLLKVENEVGNGFQFEVWTL